MEYNRLIDHTLLAADATQDKIVSSAKKQKKIILLPFVSILAGFRSVHLF